MILSHMTTMVTSSNFYMKASIAKWNLIESVFAAMSISVRLQSTSTITWVAVKELKPMRKQHDLLHFLPQFPFRLVLHWGDVLTQALNPRA